MCVIFIEVHARCSIYDTAKLSDKKQSYVCNFLLRFMRAVRGKILRSCPTKSSLICVIFIDVHARCSIYDTAKLLDQKQCIMCI